jgi:hypothetical protein
MRTRITAILLLAAALVVLPAFGPDAAAQAPSAKKKVLVVWGGWPGHEPKQTVDVFIPWLTEQGFEVEVSNTLDAYLDTAKLKTLALIVQSYTMGQLTPPQEKSLLEAVRSGVGLAGWHGGLGDAFRSSTGYEFMVGGSWVAHPGNVFDYTVQITKPQDPITSGLAAFSLKSEQYYMLVDPNVEVLATTTFSGAHAPWIAGTVMPVAWKKLFGQGRIFYSSLGHVATDFNVPEVKTIMQRGMLWAARMPGTGDDPKPTNPYATR